MSKADKMFEELGYDKKENCFAIEYKFKDMLIRFELGEQLVSVLDDDENQEYEPFNMDELQAINEKVKELGWIE